MISVNFNGNTAYLLDDWPHWDSEFELAASIAAVTERGLTGRETRRVTGDTLRLEASFTCLLTNSAAITGLRNSLQAISTEQVLCPCWPAGFAAGVTPPVTAAYYATFNADYTFNSIQPAAALPFALYAAPLMVGYLKDIPSPDLVNDVVARVDYHFVDADVYPLSPAAYAPPAGLNAAGGARPLFPFTPDWSTIPQSGQAAVDIDRRQIGMLRVLASAYYAQRSRRKVTQFFRLQNAEPFNLLAFFVAMGGEQNNFWLGAALSEAALTANVGAGDTALHVDNGAALGTNAFVVLNDNNNRAPLAVANVAGNVWNLVAAPGTAFNAASTRVESLVLARFDDLKLALKFSRPDLATAALKFCELPWETNAVGGETYGTTMGALPATAILFVFTLTSPSGTTTWRYTNFERDLTDAGANTYSSKPFEFDSITETAVLDRQNLRLKSRNFAGNPLSLLMPFQLEWPLMLQIIEADITGSVAGNLRTYFYGEVGDCDVEPPFLDATCSTLSSIFDRTLPRRLYQRTDNWVLFETANGLNAADWQWNAVVVSYNNVTGALVVGTITSTNGAVLAAHFFAAGYCIITTGAATQVRMIGDSLAVAAGQLTLYPASALFTAPNVGDVVNLFAGYDGQSATAIAKFNNYSHFGGFPFMPVGNPSVLRITQPTGGGGKK